MGIFTLFKPLQPEKAASPMAVILLGRTISFNIIPQNIYLEIDSLASVEHLVKVELREEFNPLTPEIAFRCRLDKKEPMDCMTTIVRCVRELDQQFIRSKKLRFVYRQSSSTKDEWEDLLERCTEHINEMWKHRYGLG